MSFNFVCNKYYYSLVLNTRYTIQVHILCLLAVNEPPLSSDFIASSINCNAVLVRKELASLKKAGFIETSEGKNGGASLLRKAEEIFMDEIFITAYPDKNLFGQRKNDANPNCIIGKNINHIMNRVNEESVNALRKQLNTICLKDLIINN